MVAYMLGMASDSHLSFKELAVISVQKRTCASHLLSTVSQILDHYASQIPILPLLSMFLKLVWSNKYRYAIISAAMKEGVKLTVRRT